MPFILILVFIYSISKYVDITPLSVYSGASWYQYLTYNLCHCSFLHLTTNSFVFLLYWKKIIKPHTNLYFSIPTIILSSVAAAVLAISETPTMGASSICYSMIAIYATGMNNPYHISLYERKRFLIILLISFFITFFFSNINTLLHVYSVLITTLICLLNKKFMYAKKNKE